MSMFPPLSLSPPYPLVGLRAADLSSTYLVVTFVAFTVLFWDWACQISNERDLVWNAKPAYGHGLARRQAWWQPGQRWTKWCFLSSRYLALAQAVLVVFLFVLAKTMQPACDAMRVLPFTFSVVSFSAHTVMVLRMYGLYGQSKTVLFGLGALAVLDLIVQFVADTFIQPIYFPLPISGNHICYLHPSSAVFSLAFISPTIFHHIILVLTLVKAYSHLKAEQLVGGSVMRVLRRDQIIYVLTICLVNFANVVLVLQGNSMGYKLINFFPAMVLTQIFLGRIVFSLRAYSNVSSTVGETHSLPSSSFGKVHTASRNSSAPLHHLQLFQPGQHGFGDDSGGSGRTEKSGQQGQWSAGEKEYPDLEIPSPESASKGSPDTPSSAVLPHHTTTTSFFDKDLFANSTTSPTFPSPSSPGRPISSGSSWNCPLSTGEALLLTPSSRHSRNSQSLDGTRRSPSPAPSSLDGLRPARSIKRIPVVRRGSEHDDPKASGNGSDPDVDGSP